MRRGVPTKNLTPGTIERAANDTVRRTVTLQQGIPTEAAKEIVKFLKDRKLKKVQAAIQADQVRVSSASKDELQEAIRLLREHDFGVALQFGNYRAEAMRHPPAVAARALWLTGHRRPIALVASPACRRATRTRRSHPAKPTRSRPSGGGQEYVDLHAQLEPTVPDRRRRTPRQQQIDQRQRALGTLIQGARTGAAAATSSIARSAP